MLRHGDTLGCSLKNERASRSLAKTGLDLARFPFFLLLFSGWFREAFWSDFGVIVGAILHKCSMFFSIKKCIGFWIAFGRPFGGFLGGLTLENGALVYTKRSF